MEYGLQMYSVRDTATTDFEGALRSVAALGYTSVELAGTFGHTPEEVRGMLDRYGLALTGAHVGLGALEEGAIEETAAYHRALGTPALILPWASFETPAELDRVVDTLNAAMPVLKDAGIALGYHNHAHEFERTSYGVLPMEALCERTEVFFEIDTYWVYAAGLDPVSYVESLGERVKILHLKDGTAAREDRALGEGTAPVREVIDYAVRQGLPMVVESESCDPTGLEEVGRCMRYLASIEEAR